MGIWNQIAKNILLRPRTHRPGADVPYPDGFRGELLHDAALCTACGSCAAVCSPAAIEVDRTTPYSAVWRYRLLQCTSCGRCAAFCPTGALSFERRPAGPQSSVQWTEHPIAVQACPRCGEPVIPLPQAVLEEKYGSPVPVETEQLNRLCERCRRKVSSEQIKRSFTGR